LLYVSRGLIEDELESYDAGIGGDYCFEGSGFGLRDRGFRWSGWLHVALLLLGCW
jgi:hypothetical protein